MGPRASLGFRRRERFLAIAQNRIPDCPARSLHTTDSAVPVPLALISCSIDLRERIFLWPNRGRFYVDTRSQEKWEFAGHVIGYRNCSAYLHISNCIMPLYIPLWMSFHQLLFESLCFVFLFFQYLPFVWRLCLCFISCTCSGDGNCAQIV
jgi:hypothetical protein